MEKFLQAKGIETLRMVEDGVDKYYAYNEELLARNILVEYYHAENGDDESESTVWVLTYDSESSHSYYMFIQVGIVDAAPIQTYRLIVDLFDILAQCDLDNLMEDLGPISRNVSGSDIWSDPKKRKEQYKADRKKIDVVISHIRKHRQ